MAKNTGKVREKSGNFVSPQKWEPWFSQSTDDLKLNLNFPLNAKFMKYHH